MVNHLAFLIAFFCVLSFDSLFNDVCLKLYKLINQSLFSSLLPHIFMIGSDLLNGVCRPIRYAFDVEMQSTASKSES